MSIADLLVPKYRHLLWKDEIGDGFVLTKYAEIYLYSKSELCLLCFNKNKAKMLQSMKGISFVEKTDEPLWKFLARIDMLNTLIELDSHKKRPNIKGKWIADKKNRLGHDIIPYQPMGLYNESRPNEFLDQKGAYNAEKRLKFQTKSMLGT